MKSDDGKILARLAEAITDETEINWDAERAAHPELSGPLGRLRLIEQIVGIHRTPPAGEVAVGETLLFPWRHLQVVEELGHGGFGAVYRAYDPRLQREVALKLLHPRLSDRPIDNARFLAEARRMAQVRHPGVLAIHGVDEHEGQPGFWTDLLDGETLAERLEREGPSGAGETAAIGLELCRALAAVHAAGVVHGDVKAANVMRDVRGRIVLMDFGAGSDPGPDSAVGRGAIVGTPMVLAPELFDGAAPSPASDLYAVGVLMYLLVTGRYPVTAESVAELHRKLQAGRCVPLLDRRPDLPVDFAGVIEHALSPDPAQRYGSAGEMAVALAKALRQETTIAPGRSARWWRLGRWVLSAAAVCAVVAGILLIRREAPATDRADRGARPGSSLAVPVSLEVEATLYRSLGGAREALPSGALVRPGDTMYLEYRGSRPARVYILNEDDQGDVFLLFPLPGQDLENPLPAGVRHRLPGPHAGVFQHWQVTGGQGSEAFLLIAATKTVDWLEHAIADFPPASPTRPVRSARLDPSNLIGTRGIEGIVAAEPVGDDPDAAPVLAEIARRLTASATEPGGIWIRQFVVYNAGR